MPYSKIEDLPEAVQKLPMGAKRIWMATFNAAAKAGKDEKASFQISWSAVKKKYEKKGGRWVARAQGAAEEQTMGLIQTLRAIHADYRRVCPKFDEAGLTQAEALLAQVEADPTANGRLLTYLDQYVVPTFDFAQAYYNLNTPTTEHLNDFPGSLNHRIRVICCALQEERDEYLGRGGFVMAVYPDHVVVCKRDGYCYYDVSSGEPPETY